MVQNEYRKVTKNSNLIVNFAHTNNYKSNLSKKKIILTTYSQNLNLDLNLENFSKSEININN
jgi:hypothetical protein